MSLVMVIDNNNYSSHKKNLHVCLCVCVPVYVFVCVFVHVSGDLVHTFCFCHFMLYSKRLKEDEVPFTHLSFFYFLFIFAYFLPCFLYLFIYLLYFRF